MDVANLPPCLNTGQNDSLCCPSLSWLLQQSCSSHASPSYLAAWLNSLAGSLVSSWSSSPGKDPSSPIEIFPMHTISQCWTPGNPFPLVFIIIIGNCLFLCFLSLLLRSWKNELPLWIQTSNLILILLSGMFQGVPIYSYIPKMFGWIWTRAH